MYDDLLYMTHDKDLTIQLHSTVKMTINFA